MASVREVIYNIIIYIIYNMKLAKSEAETCRRQNIFIILDAVLHLYAFVDFFVVFNLNLRM